MRLTRKYEAEAAHQLSAGVPEGHPCRRLHGHRYEIWVTIIGDVNPETGMVLEYNEIDRRVFEVLDLVDHRFINLLGYEVSLTCMWGTTEDSVGAPLKAPPLVASTKSLSFEFKEPELAAKVRTNSTVENLATWLKAELVHRFPRTSLQVGAYSFLEAQVYAVRIKEDSRSEVEA